jgi:hypothetical protein
MIAENSFKLFYSFLMIQKEGQAKASLAKNTLNIIVLHTFYKFDLF